jgi:hypothetical protein
MDFNSLYDFDDDDVDSTPIEFDKFSSGFLTDTKDLNSNNFGFFDDDDVVSDPFTNSDYSTDFDSDSDFGSDLSSFDANIEDDLAGTTDFEFGLEEGELDENQFGSFTEDADSDIDFSGFIEEDEEDYASDSDSELEFSGFIDEIADETSDVFVVDNPLNTFETEIEDEVEDPINSFEDSIESESEYKLNGFDDLTNGDLDDDSSFFNVPLDSDGLPILETNTPFITSLESLDIDTDGFDFYFGSDNEDYNEDTETLTNITAVYDEAPSSEIASLFSMVKPDLEYIPDDETNREHLRNSISESVIETVITDNSIDIIDDDDDDFDDMDFDDENIVQEQEHLEQERLEQENKNRLIVEREKAERERITLEHATKMRIEKEQLEKERLEFENMKKLQLEKERLEKERLLKELQERERKEQSLLQEKERLEKELKDKANKSKETLNIPNNVNQKQISVENMSVDQYISKYGKSRDVYSKYCSKDEIQRKFTQRQIKLAIQNGTILEVDDAYLI